MDRDHQLNLERRLKAKTKTDTQKRKQIPKREEKTPLLIYNEDRMGNPCLNLINN